MDAAKHLISRGGDYTLLAAVCFDEKEKVQELLPGSSGDEKLTALTAAAFYGNTALTDLLLKAGVDPNGYPANGFHTHATPLHQGVYSGKFDIVKLLVVAGADITAKDKIYSSTALEWARHMQTGDLNEDARNSFKKIENFLAGQ
jgi:peptide-methionine (S)-S-oxide reductase